MTDRITLFANVLLPLPVPKLYTYRIPHEWNETIEIGHRVVVQFGPRKVYAGIVVDFSDTPPGKYQASYILDILDPEPVVSPLQLKFWKWISEYYMCFQGEVMHAALPAGLRLQSESVIELSPDFDEDASFEMDENEWKIVQYLIRNKKMTLDDAAKQLELKNPMKYIKSLYARGLIHMHEEVKERYKPKIEVYLKLSDEWSNEQFAKETLAYLEKKAPKQANVILSMLGNPRGEFSKKELQENYGIEPAHIKSLEKKGLLEIQNRQVSRLEQFSEESMKFELAPFQQEAVKSISISFSKNKNVLLYGKTGSGKTFIYQHFINEILKKEGQVLYLVPEVGLTEQLVSRLEKYFGKNMGVWHNYYSGSERTEIYDKVKSGEIKVLLGARSAVFAPFANLQLIVVDEEHENSLKQFEKRPHYHGRDAALQLAVFTNARVILGSATPSYEMLEACKEEKLTRVDLKTRFLKAPEPEITVVNIAEAKKQNRMKQVFSLKMLEMIQETLDNGSQVIVFQNRKGYVPYISCSFCGYTPHCVNCDIALTYYKSIHAQKCNYCGYHQDPPAHCAACGSAAMTMKGFGTERITEELDIFFPEARISRFDNESIRKRTDFQRILNGFAGGEIDILVGTQLLSKGLDFENVGLVCIPDADLLLNIPDFRSHERAFQQMHQVAGRAGRGDKQGKVLIQCFQSTHPVIQAVVENDFAGLSEVEIGMRKTLDYPPFSRLIRVTIKHKDSVIARNAAVAYGNTVKKALTARVLGPQEPVISKIRNWYLQNLMVKMTVGKDKFSKIKAFLQDAAEVMQKTEGFKGTRIDFDVDPV